ncbi:YdeI/OmpD-associated family protein [Pinibacter aurantiacus]|uniref:YdeI/OmpD-associated family protein n=1 Tax=Pinibacter aurantiacus TaxID=2851599 RepID=A0A9E2S3X0_9BACT|nr:YdeI/OmpD-associated family protein [Pinibacter aurantiacus]MBV4356108.1 YdeI/OmpD-associated family protein [Pinibacter aurantiacus]
MSQNVIEKLQLKEEKNLLIQGLPSTIEKQFSKLFFAKNVTPLLKSRGIDFALVFAINECQLNGILADVLPALNNEGKFWVAYPKSTSKIASNLNRSCSWQMLTDAGFENVSEVTLDHVWTAIRFHKNEQAVVVIEEEVEVFEEEEEGDDDVAVAVPTKKKTVATPPDFAKALRRSKVATTFFEKLSAANQTEYVNWITGARKEETRLKRIETAIERLGEGRKTPSDK